MAARLRPDDLHREAGLQRGGDAPEDGGPEAAGDGVDDQDRRGPRDHIRVRRERGGAIAAPYRRPRGGLPTDLVPRIVVAVPAAAVLVGVLAVGGWLWAVAMALLAALGTAELLRLGRRAGWGRLSTLLLAVAWLGTGFGHAIILRGLEHGAILVLAVLLATFLGDTAAQLVGTAFGRRPLAPRISPAKTVEGVGAGLVVATGSVVGLALVVAEPWFSLGEALLLGLGCAAAAPAGDLLESALKRRAGVKDSGRLFGPHGGVLDRVDAAIAAAFVGCWVALLVV